MSVTYRRERSRADVPRLAHPRGAARASRADVLGRGAGAGHAVDAGAIAVLPGAARRGAARARGRQASGCSARPTGRRSLTGSPTSRSRSAGIIGVYLLSQLCVVVTFWAVFTLGRRIVGAAHAAMAILLMAGISVFTVPTLEFGPARARDAAHRADAAVRLSRARRQQARRLDRSRRRRSACCCSPPMRA